jgi:hypothetical protein
MYVTIQSGNHITAFHGISLFHLNLGNQARFGSGDNVDRAEWFRKTFDRLTFAYGTSTQYAAQNSQDG